MTSPDDGSSGSQHGWCGIRVGLPPLDAMFNSNGTAYAAAAREPKRSHRAFSSGSTATGFPSGTGFRADMAPDYELTPCLAPLKSLRNDIHVISGIDNPNARVDRALATRHHKSMSALVSGTAYTGRGAGGASIDQVIAGAYGGARPGSTRCRLASVRSRTARTSTAT